MKYTTKIQIAGNDIAFYLTILLLLSLAVLLMGCSSNPNTAGAPPHADASQLQAGVAEIEITPPIGFRLAGYFNERISTGIHDPLKAKALVLRQGREEFLWVFCDLVGFSLHVTTNARAFASRQTGIPLSHIVIAATHSHTGPLFDDVRGDYFHQTAIEKNGKDPNETVNYPAFLTDQLVKVIIEAHAKVEPAELSVDITTQAGLPFNRRYHMKNGTVAFNPGILNSNIVGPAGPVDSDVSILVLKDLKSRKPIGGLTVFAMHCDTAGGTEISADYPFFLQEMLRKQFGPDYVSAFGAGTCGDLNHVDVSQRLPYNGFANCARLGNKIGETIVHDLPNLKTIDRPTLAVKSTTLTLPLQTATAEELAEAKARMPFLEDSRMDFATRVKTVKVLDLERMHSAQWPMEIQVFRLDSDTAIVCLPAELFVEFGLAIKKASPFKRTSVISICNDRPAYMPTLKAFQEGSYETINSRLKPGSGEIMVKTAIKLLNELKP